VEFAIHVEPEGAGYDEVARVASVAEDIGFAVFARSDHYLPHERPVAPLGPTDAWLTMAAVARETSRVRLSVLFCNPSLRHPSVLAVALAQVDAMSGGRLEFGLGAGWFEQENDAFGFSMPVETDDRYDRRREQLDVLRGLWDASPAKPLTYKGSYYSLTDNAGLGLEPTRAFPHFVLALTDAERSILDAVGLADECNIPFLDHESTANRFAALDRACDRHARARGSLSRSVAVVACCGTSEADIDRRATVLGASRSYAGASECVVGSPRDVRDYVARFADIGVDRVYLQIRDAADLDHVRLLGDEIAAKLS
jgi:alkanesulfonate monooxygenase